MFGFTILFICLFSFKNKTDKEVKNEGFTVTGRIVGLHSGTVKLVLHTNWGAGSNITIDRVPFLNDSFVLKGKVEYPQMMRIVFEPGSWSLDFILENSFIKIKGDTSGAEHYEDEGTIGAFLKNYSVSGSRSQDDWMKYQNDQALKRYDSIREVLGNSLRTEKDIDREYIFRVQWDSVNFLLNLDKQRWIYNYAKENPSSSVGAYMLYDLLLYYPALSVETVDSTLKLFAGEARVTSYYKTLDATQNRRKALLPGKTAPDFTLFERDRSKFTLSSSRGKYVMLDFWASWCYPCRKAIPHWKDIYAKYHSKGFDIISVADDSKWSDWIKAMDKEKMPWLQVCDEFSSKYPTAKVGTLYMIPFIPFYVLIDKKGKIILYTKTEEDIDTKLNELLD